MNVLGNMVEAVKLGGAVLDLQVIRPDPRIEVDGRVVCEIDGSPVFERADAATRAVDLLVAAGRLRELAVDDHEVRRHYRTGADLVDDFTAKERTIPEAALARVRAVTGPAAIREACRLRALQRVR